MVARVGLRQIKNLRNPSNNVTKLDVKNNIANQVASHVQGIKRSVHHHL
jgi:hypothetical protein